ncbi:hypothetical protein ACWXWU_05175 [Shewanella sp. A14]
MALSITGFKEVDAEIKRIRAAQAPIIAKAIGDTVKFGNKLVVDEIFNKYGFKSKSYVESLVSYSINPQTLEGIISSSYRPTSLTRFATPRNTGYMVNTIRAKNVWFKGAFTFIGKNGNQVMMSRKKGDNSWRYLDKARAEKAGTKVPDPLYGPSVGKSFGYLRDDLEPPIIKHLRERYGHHAK